MARADNDDVYDLVLDIAANNPAFEHIANALEQLSTKPRRRRRST